jgi:hypothetical protein
LQSSPAARRWRGCCRPGRRFKPVGHGSLRPSVQVADSARTRAGCPCRGYR